jgi:D-alanyl-D-alanine carboxypeptidase
MKRIYLTTIGILFLNAYAFTQSHEAKFQALIDSVYAANPTSVGIMVHIEAPDKGISWSGVSGYSEKDTNKELQEDQPAWIASNTKTYVSTTILRLVEECKLSIDQPIKYLLSDKTRRLFEKGGYDLDEITIKHLLSHTSGIQNYANQEYIDFIDANKRHRWTRDDQLALTLRLGPPLGKPGFTYSYTDANYLLCTEIIETAEKKPFYAAMRELLKYKTLGLNNTWFPTLEEQPANTEAMAHQYWGQKSWDTYDMDISVDLYGGGGIACPTKDLARFIYDLFNANIIQDTTVLNLIFTEIKTQDEKPSNYYLGISLSEYNNLKAFGHGGFWGTEVLYFPYLNTSVSIYVLERDERKLIKSLMDQIVGILAK